MEILQNGELLTIIPLSPAEPTEWTLAKVKKWLVVETSKIRSDHLPPGFAGGATVPESVIAFLDAESMELLPDSARVEDIGFTAVLLLKGLAAIQPEMATKLEAVEGAYQTMLSGGVLSMEEKEQTLMRVLATAHFTERGTIQAGKLRRNEHLGGRVKWADEVVVEGIGSGCIFRGITAKGRQSIEQALGIEFSDDGLTVARVSTETREVLGIHPGWTLYDIRATIVDLMVPYFVDHERGQRVNDLTNWTRCVETGGSVSGPDMDWISIRLELRFRSPVDLSPALMEEFRMEAIARTWSPKLAELFEHDRRHRGDDFVAHQNKLGSLFREVVYFMEPAAYRIYMTRKAALENFFDELKNGRIFKLIDTSNSYGGHKSS